jgi:glutathione S-transferase
LKPATLHGWHLSYFAGKLRAYLVYKRIPFIDRPMDWYTLVFRARRRTGASVMPTLEMPDGRWLQDTRCIIDALEPLSPAAPIFPSTPRRRIAAELLEAWGDEWWIPIAMHTRWTYPENYALFEQEAGDALAPWAPRWLRRRLVARVATLLRSYLPTVGIVPAQYGMMESWSLGMLDLLDRHFAAVPYLLGERPTIGDFGLQGTMYGHLGRDPWPKREWIAPRRSLRDWIDRMATLDHDAVASRYGAPPTGEAPDQIPPTLEPVLRTVCREFLPMVQGILAEVQRAAPRYREGRPLPRALGAIEFPMGDRRFSRRALPFTLWKVQGIQDVFRALSEEDRALVRVWLRGLGGEALLDLPIPRLERVALRVRLVP